MSRIGPGSRLGGFVVFLCCAVLPAAASLNAAVPLPAQVPPVLPEGFSSGDWQSIHAAWDAGRHAVSQAAGASGTLQARNPGQQWTARFDGRGFVTDPDHGSWQWGLQLQRWGFAGEEQSIGANAHVSAEGGRTVYHWNAALDEWFVNDRRGLEHGYTVHARPSGEGPLQFELAIRGTLQPQISADGRDVAFLTAAGAAAVNYSGLKVWDADGVVLAASFEPSSTGLRMSIDEAGARYPLTIDPLAQQLAYLKASNTEPNDGFGYSVAVSGNTVVVGAPFEDSADIRVDGDQTSNLSENSGAAYVFRRSDDGWSQQAYLKPHFNDPGLEFGYSVAISGDTAVIGSRNSGTVEVFARSDEVWDWAVNLTGPGGTPVAVAISGDTIVAGGWTGACWSSSNVYLFQCGSVAVYERPGSDQAFSRHELRGYDREAGDTFGYSVAISGDALIVGAPNTNTAYIFQRTAGNWSQHAYFRQPGSGSASSFGWSVAISDEAAVVGAPTQSAAYVYARSGVSWSQQAYLRASAPGISDNFGGAVALSGDTLVVAADWLASAYIFGRSGESWSQQAQLQASNTSANDGFGGSVAVSADTVVVGARWESSDATGVDGDQNNDLAPGAGAAYVFGPDRFAVGGTVSGLLGGQIALQNNDGDTRTLTADGDFTFAAQIDGSSYSVTIAAQPDEPPQICSVINGAGVLAGADVTDVQVNCVASFTVGGTATGLVGGQLILQNNGGDEQILTADGAFTFAAQPDGSGYDITVASPPGDPPQTCSITNGSGLLAGANIATVQATCITDSYEVTPSASAGGSIDPSQPQTVQHGQAAAFTLAADVGMFLLDVTGSCGGSLNGTTYTTPAVTAGCTVHGNFIPKFTSATSLAASPDPARAGQPLLMQIAVSGAGSLPTDGQVSVGASSGESCVSPAPADATADAAHFECSITFESLGPRTLVATFSGSATHLDSGTAPRPVMVARIADLSVSIDDGASTVSPGHSILYLVEFRNTGPDAAPATLLTMLTSPELGSPSWNCIPFGSASCPQAQGTGEFVATIDLPADSGLYVVQTGMVPAAPADLLLAEAAAAASTGVPHFVVDPQLADNQNSDQNQTSALFADGFE